MAGDSKLFLFATFPAFYHPASLYRDPCIKNKVNINCANDGVARLVST